MSEIQSAYVRAAKAYQDACEREETSRATFLTAAVARRDAYSKLVKTRDAWTKFEAWKRQRGSVEYVVGDSDILGELDGDADWPANQAR